MGKLLVGDVMEQLRTLPDESVDCCVTSPPYWGLRDYGTAKWEGGSTECDHKSGKQKRGAIPGSKQATNNNGEGGADWDVCGKCGATRIDAQIGLEKTPEEYVARIVEVFREVKRVLKPAGTLWLNLGDSYISNPGDRAKVGGFQGKASKERILAESSMSMNKHNVGLKPKDLVGIPWRVAFALQNDGWWLRQDIIWAKPNPMPESVTDRCTKSHEYIFLLSKSPKYYYDADAVKQPAAGVSGGACFGKVSKMGEAKSAKAQAKRFDRPVYETRNLRDVWTIPVRPFKGAHFATFPSYLPEICIKAGTSEKGCCSKCGNAWTKIVEKGNAPKRELRAKMVGVIPGRNSTTRMNSVGMEAKPVLGISWAKTCSCDADIVPSVVLDPFFGAGTVGLVAEHLKRNWIGIEINPEYAKIAKERINGNH